MKHVHGGQAQHGAGSMSEEIVKGGRWLLRQFNAEGNL